MLARALATLSTRRLPKGWSEPEIVEDVIVADGLTIYRAGIAAVGPTGEEVTGSAATPVMSPLARSFYELFERMSTIEALDDQLAIFATRGLDGTGRGIVPARQLSFVSETTDRWRPARSNGIALHSDWESAALRAFWELVERDRVLRAWYGTIVPRLLDVDWKATPLSGTGSYEWRAYALSNGDGPGDGVHVALVLGFPRYEDVPLVIGFGARPSADRALESAMREAMQVLAFLWGEPLPQDLPPLVPKAGYHLDFWQLPAHRELLRRWLDGEHVKYASTNSKDVRFGIDDVTFVDLTPSWLQESGLYVAKALCPRATPLFFGDSPLGAHLPPELRVHPIA